MEDGNLQILDGNTQNLRVLRGPKLEIKLIPAVMAIY